MIEPQVGDIFEFRYPFIHDEYSEQDEGGVATVKCWRPGCRFENDHNGETLTLADGIGQQILTCIGRYKPGKYPERIFYTRKWRDPSGKVFGKGACRVASLIAFRSIVSGYRHPFEMAEKS